MLTSYLQQVQCVVAKLGNWRMEFGLINVPDLNLVTSLIWPGLGLTGYLASSSELVIASHPTRQPLILLLSTRPFCVHDQNCISI